MATRCEWAQSDLMIEYHDREWGVPSHDDTHLFEHLTLEGAQAGLNWQLVLKKREGYRRAFEGYDLARIAAFDDDKAVELAADPGIVRNRLKIRSVIANAKAALDVQTEFGSLDRFLWGLAGNAARQNAWKSMKELPASTPESAAMSKAMAAKGFRFVGPTGMYAFMQACGMVNDHVTGCFRHAEVKAMTAPGRRKGK
jgi:DNA-3-methyladenine glycosylase I